MSSPFILSITAAASGCSDTISPLKANSLYWLGRYAERVYLSLHFLRRFCDTLIEGDDLSEAFASYAARLDLTCDYAERDSFMLGHIHDPANPSSVHSALIRANDNAMLLRDDIKSETLAYIQLSLGVAQRCAKSADLNIDHLYPVTDHLLAFWGSVDSRPLAPRTRSLLRLGKMVEDIDMRLRFGYPAARLRESFGELIRLHSLMPAAIGERELTELTHLLADDSCSTDRAKRAVTLAALNSLVKL